MSVHKAHERMISALQEKRYERIEIKRLGPDCYLLITCGGETNALVDRHGTRKVYRHAWQAREWLEKTFGIEPETIHVEKLG